MGVPPVVEIAAHRRTEREQGQDELWNCVLARTVVLFAVYDELSTQVRMVQQSLTLPDGTTIPVVVTVEGKKLASE